MTFRELLNASLHNNMLVFNEDDELIGSYSDMGMQNKVVILETVVLALLVRPSQNFCFHLLFTSLFPNILCLRVELPVALRIQFHLLYLQPQKEE